MKIIVLGASGQIGSVIYDGLSDRHKVIGTSRKFSSKYLRFDPFHSDWSQLGEVNVLINCVGQIGKTKRSSFYHVHVDLVKQILKNRAVIGNPKIIQISALGASPKHEVEFLKTKGIADALMLQHPNTVVVRPSIVCTHRTMLVRKMLMLFQISQYTAGLVVVPKGFLKTKIQPVLPQDLVGVIDALCLNHVVHNIVNVVGSERISFDEMLTMMFKSRKKKYRTIEVPKRLCDLVVKYGVSTVFPRVINSQQYQLLFEDNIADSNMLQQLLERAPASSRQFFTNEFNYANH